LNEGSDDYGGPFRESMVNLVAECEIGAMPLLIKSPNNRNEHGSNRECFILDFSSKSPTHLELFKFLGGIIGFGIMSKSPIPFNFAPTVWKQILCDEMTLSDLEQVDAYSHQVLVDLKTYGSTLPQDEFEYAVVDQYFTTILSNGDEVTLAPEGETKKVTKANVNEFVDLVVKTRFAEAQDQIAAIQSGIKCVLKDLSIM